MNRREALRRLIGLGAAAATATALPAAAAVAAVDSRPDVLVFAGPEMTQSQLDVIRHRLRAMLHGAGGRWSMPIVIGHYAERTRVYRA